MSHSRVAEASNSFNNNIGSFNTVNYFGSVDERAERAELLAWLSPLDPWIRHRGIRENRVKDVGDWLLRTEKYRNWFDSTRGGESDNSALFCYGDPGVGKTYITSLVIDSIYDWAVGGNATVVCFYFDFAARGGQSPTAVLSSLLKQLVGGLENIPAKIIHAFRDQRAAGGRRLGLGQVVEMLQDLSSSRRTFICIDAIDECMAGYRARLFESLKQILSKSLNTRIFLAGRLYVLDEVEKHLAQSVADLSAAPTRDDIIRFLRDKLKEDIRPDAMDKSLEEEIMKTIPATVSEIFLLVSLNIEAILQETTLHQRRAKLSAMANGLDLKDAYHTTIQRIKEHGGSEAKLGMAALMWISHSRRPLKVDEICHALGVEIGSTDINTENVPSIRTVLDCCQGLVAVDRGSSIIRLIHSTLKEHLSGHPDLFDRPHSQIAELCLTYLNFQTIQDLPASSAPDTRSMPFLEYCSLHWGTHMRMGLSDHSRELALNLLNQYDNHIAAELLSKSTCGQRLSYKGPFSALHCISYFGIAEVAIDLIRMKRWDLNELDSVGLTPLMWAARCGREEVVKVLLEQNETKPDIRDGLYGQTALSWASRSGHGGVVRLFLGPLFVNPGRVGRWRGTPRVVRLLFGRKYINPGKSDNYGRTPLSLAVRDGHESVVELLLGRKEVNPDQRDRNGRTLLSLAAGNGRDGVVKLLLGRTDVSPDRPDDSGRTPLSWAAKHGCDKVVELLLEREDVSPDRQDKNGRTPLWWAAWNERVGVVKLLLEREDVDPSAPDNDGQTLLSWATRNGRVGVVQLLLGRKDVDHDALDNDGRTVLSWAARNGHDGVVKLLLEREGVSPDRPENDGQTPLSLAARHGHDAIVKLLLEREDVNPNGPDNADQTLLLWATRNGRVGVVELLLGRKEIDPYTPDRDGRTVFSWAARNGHDGVVKLLLEREDVRPNRSENDRRTPLSLAAGRGYDLIVKLLLEREDIGLDKPDIDGQTPLFWAARNGFIIIVKLLLERGGVSPDRQDNGGRTPLSWAAQSGNYGIVELLLERQDVKPDRPDKDGRTPLSWAAQSGNYGIVELLLERQDVKPDRPDKDGRTPLSWAAQSGNYGIVELLLEQEDVSPHLPDNDGQTPLWWAAQNGRFRLVELLEARTDEITDLVSIPSDITPAPPPWCVLL